MKFAGPIITRGDPASESRMVEGRLDVLAEKVRKISSGVKTAFENRREIPTDADVDEVYRLVDSEVQSDVNYIVSQIVASRNAGSVMAGKLFAQEKGGEERLTLMHEFKEMLVGLQHSRSDGEVNRSSVNISNSQHVQVGNGNLNIEPQVQNLPTPSETNGSKLLWWVLGLVSSLVVGLAVAYLVYRFGWNNIPKN